MCTVNSLATVCMFVHEGPTRADVQCLVSAAGRRRRPGVVNSGDFAEEDRNSGFEMRSTAEVYAMFEKFQNRNVPGEPLPVEIADGDCQAG
jgi:hypothetical protein